MVRYERLKLLFLLMGAAECKTLAEITEAAGNTKPNVWNTLESWRAAKLVEKRGPARSHLYELSPRGQRQAEAISEELEQAKRAFSEAEEEE